jgi:hypothetical protein
MIVTKYVVPVKCPHCGAADVFEASVILAPGDQIVARHNCSATSSGPWMASIRRVDGVT